MQPVENIGIRMTRETLADLPAVTLPSGFTFRFYRSGDRATWAAVYTAAEPILTITPEVFDREFHGDEDALQARMLFLIDPDGHPVGTSTAWYDDRGHDSAWGRVHWVAMIPAYQGRGLAKPLLVRTLERLRELGHTRAYLYTSSARVPAVTLYLTLGFRPDIQSAKERQGWEDLLRVIRAEFRPSIEAALQRPPHLP